MPPPVIQTSSHTSSTYLLNATQSIQGTTQVVTVTGEIDISSAREVEVVLRRALGARPETLLFDLSGLAFCDSSGIHLLFQTDRHAKLQRTRFLVIPPTGPARRVFELCSVDEEISLVPAAATD